VAGVWPLAVLEATAAVSGNISRGMASSTVSGICARSILKKGRRPGYSFLTGHNGVDAK
jgi:hypothetical protein